MAAQITPRKLTLKTPSGKVVEITVGAYLMQPSLTRISVAGWSGHGQPRNLAGDGTITLHSGLKTATVQLDKPSAQAVQQALDAVAAELDALPEVQLRNLMERRESLRLGYVGAAEDAAKRRDRSWAAGDEAGAFPATEPAVEAARRALAEFDDAHPEVSAEMKRKRQESAKQAMWD